MQEEALRSDDFRANSSSDTPIGHRSNDYRHGSTPIFSNATPFSTSRTTRRQSILTALSPGPSRMTGGSSPYPDDDPPPPGNFRGYAPPTRAAFTGPSLHLKSDCPHICWQLSHDKGPYGGNHDRFMKFVYKLPSDATTELMLLLNFLRTQFQATGFHHRLVPDMVRFILWLTSPNPRLMRRICPIVTVLSGRIATRTRFLATPCSSCRFARQRCPQAPIFARVVSEQSYGGNGFAVINELLRLYSSHIHGTRAPSFDTATSKKISQGPSETIPEYERRFTLWLQSLRLYREFSRYQDSEVTMWFVDGLLACHQLFFTQEYVDLKQFHLLHRLADDEPRLPDCLQCYFLCERLRLANHDDILSHHPSRLATTPLGAQVAAIVESPAASAAAPPLDPSAVDVAALHHRFQPGRTPGPGGPSTRGFTIEKPVPCGYSPCGGRSRPPNVCCVCDAPTHRVNRCWHLLGLPTDRLARVSAFKHLKDAGDAPFAKARVAAVDAGTEDIPSTYDSPTELYDAEILDTSTDMRSLEAQYHPGYDFPAQNAAIDYFDSLACADDDSIPDLYWPGHDFHDSPRDLISSSSNFDSVTSAVAPPDLSALLRFRFLTLWGMVYRFYTSLHLLIGPLMS
jgi:hypothetical protein